MRRYVTFSLIISIALFALSCRNNPSITMLLNKVEDNIELHPDSSLNILNSLQLRDINKHEDKARYALLKSMALDKNYIDVTNDSLISVALSYYEKHGTADEKLKSYYYNGVIYRNKEDYEGAMRNYILAEQFHKECRDYISVGRLFNAKAYLNSILFRDDQAMISNKLAAYYYMKGKDTIRYITAMNNMTSLLLSSPKTDSLNIYFDRIKQYERYMTPRQRSNYFANLINYKIIVSDTTLRKTIEEQQKTFRDNTYGFYWIILARAYHKLGEYKLAIDALNTYKENNKKLNNLYYYYSSLIYNSLGDYKRAYEYLKDFQYLSDKKDYKIITSDAKMLEERFIAQEKDLKRRYHIIILSLSVVIILAMMFLLYRYFSALSARQREKIQIMQKQKEQLYEEYEKAIHEKNNLVEIIENNKIDPNIKQLLQQRIDVLNKFIVYNISGINLELAKASLKELLSNNTEFIKSTKLSFEITHPKFISYLQENNLSDDEMCYCCLYCIGLNGNEIANYLDIKYFYKRSSSIRKKLNIENVNIDKFLINKLEELS